MGMFDGIIEKLTAATEDAKAAIKARDNQKWEYQYSYINTYSTLNELGENRWELVTVTPSDLWVFKRPKLEESSAQNTEN